MLGGEKAGTNLTTKVSTPGRYGTLAALLTDLGMGKQGLLQKRRFGGGEVRRQEKEKGKGINIRIWGRA